MAMNPHTPMEMVKNVLDMVDHVLVMTVNPGFGGQAYIPTMLDKISQLRQTIVERDLDVDIEVDGGIKAGNAWKVIEAGANAIVSGSGVFNQPDYAAAIQGIRDSKSQEAVLV